LNKISNIIRKNREKRRKRTIKLMRYVMVGCFLLLCFTIFSGCNGVKHVIQIEEPTDHTQGDDGGKLKYKIIFGDVNQKE